MGPVPGPVIRVKVGDTIRVHLKNPATSQLAHSIDFHASQVAWNDEMTSINPGEELVYEWTADYAGVWMYHCGTSPALHHIANGMYGMVIVEPREGLPQVDHEFALVQSEWYLGPQGKEADLDKAMAAAPGARPRDVQRRCEPVQGPSARGRHRRLRPNLRPQRRSERRQLVPRGRYHLRHGHQGRRHAHEGQRRQLGQPGRRPRARRRARSWSSRPPRTASTRSSRTPSTSSGPAGAGDLVADVADTDAIRPAIAGCEAVIHLATGAAAGWPDLLRTEIAGTHALLRWPPSELSALHPGLEQPCRRVLRAARGAGDLARPESAAAVGRDPVPIGDYGAAKVAAEAIGARFALGASVGVSCLRIGTVRTVDDLGAAIETEDFSWLSTDPELVRARLERTWCTHDRLREVVDESWRAPSVGS